MKWTWIVGGLSLVLASPALAGNQQPEKVPAPKESAVPDHALSLAECQRIAHDRQPAIAAQAASLAAAHSGKKALDNLGAAAVLRHPDLPMRRKQSDIGVEIAEAALRQVESETTYNVTRLYFTVLYARAQFKLANEVVETFDSYYNIVSKGVQGAKPPKEWTTDTVAKLRVYLRLAESRRAEAQQGIERAVCALREAMGLEANCALAIADEQLPDPPPQVQVNKDTIVALALSQRGEIGQAALAVDVFDLEVDAQGRHCLPGAYSTFAAGGDIHAKTVPQTRTNGEYHPGAVPPEMPVMLVGRKCDRMQRARDFAHRAQAVSEKTHDLIVLEAEDFYHRYLETREKVEKTGDAKKAGYELAENTRKAFRDGQKVKVEDVLAETMLGAQSRAQYNEALWHYLLTLAGLERVTGGGFCAGFAK